MKQRLLGFFGQTNKWTHDHSLAISANGEIEHYIELERISRKKYDNNLPNELPDLINKLGIAVEDTQIGFANTFALDDSFFKVSDNSIRSESDLVKIEHEGHTDLKEIETEGVVNGIKTNVTIVPHEIAHLFSSIPFYGMFKDNALLVHIDGAASICNASAWLYKNHSLKLLERTTSFHRSLLNFSYNDLTFEVLKTPKKQHLSMPGKLMGFASYGKVQPEFHQWLKENNFFRNYKNSSNSKMLDHANDKFGYKLTEVIQKHEFSYNYAASVQSEFNHNLFNFIRKHQNSTGAKILYYSGGAALNIKLNSIIVNSNIFTDVYIPPPTSDSGLSLGVVAFLSWKNNQVIKQSSHQPYLNNFGVESPNFNPEYSPDEICEDLINEKIIGICYGFAEAGPRALGHRSILAIPNTKKIGERVSQTMKQREWYRPIAPIVLASEIENLFEDYTTSVIMESMLYEFKVQDKAQNRIPAVTHVDATARAQIVQEDNSNLQNIIEILTIMRDKYDIPCLINTSFNSAGEPIVHTNDDAMKSARKMGLHAVILNNKYVRVK